MARDVKDELQGQTNGAQTMTADSMASPQIPNSIQVQLDERLQRLAVNIVMDDFDAAKASRDQVEYGQTSKGVVLTHETWLKELKDLYYGNRIPKVIPWRFCSNRSLMIAMAILETLHARILPAVYNEDLVRWRPNSAIFADKADSVEKVMFWWVRVHVKMRDFFDRWTRYVLGFGRVLTETTWDVQLVDKGEQSQVQPIVDEIGNPIMGQDGNPAQLPPGKLMERIERTRSDIVNEDDVFMHTGATDIQRDPVVIRKKFLYKDLQEMEREGKVVNVTTPSVDGARILKEFLIIPGTSGTSSMTPEVDEEIRDIKRRNQVVTVLEWWGGIDLDEDGFPEQVRIMVVPDHNIYLSGINLYNISNRGMRPLDLTLLIPRMDDPHSLRGLGVLEQVKELANEIDAIFNQMTDGNTLQVLKPGFYDPGGDLNAANLTLAPNKWSPVSNPQQSIFVPEINVSTEKLIMAIRLVVEFIEKLTAASAYQFGNVGATENVGGSGTATRTEQLASASNERHTIPAQRLREGASRLMTVHLDLLQKNLPPGLEQRILGSKNEPVFDNPVTEESIAGEYDAYLLPDDSMGSKEAERQLTQLLYTLLLQNPLVVTDPAKIYRPTADVLKAFGKDPELYLGPVPPINDLLTPEDENMLMLGGDFTKVRANVMQNPIQHMLTHQQLLSSQWLAMQTPEVQQQVMQFVQSHIQEHMQMMQLMMQLSQRMATKGKGGTSAAYKPGSQNGGPGPAQAIGPEPGVGSIQPASSGAYPNQRG